MSRFAPLKSRKDVWLNDLAFSHVDDLGNRWIIENIDGWWDLPPMSMGEVDRAYHEDGSYYEPGRYSSRAIRLTGKIIPASNNTNSANLARQEFNRRLNLVRKTGLLQVLESPELGGGKQSEVVTVARPLMKADKLNGVIDFDVQFRAPDPRKYSVDLSVVEALLLGTDSTAGRSYGLVYNRTYVGTQSYSTAVVNNAGDYNTYGVIRLHGPVDNPGAHHLDSDRHLTFPGVRLGVGQYIDVNLGEKTIISESGTSLRDRLDDGSRWFNFDEGDNRVELLGTAYLEYVPSVQDVKNIVIDPSFEGQADPATVHTVRSNIIPNPSGLASQTLHEVRESMFVDPQAVSGANFAEGTVNAGVISSPTVKLMYGTGTMFPIVDTTSHHFTQVEIRPTTPAVTTATLTLAGMTSGSVPLTAGEWTSVRVDSHTPSGDYEVVLSLPGASSTDTVEIRNIMVIRSQEPIAGEYPFWAPVEGTENDGTTTIEVDEGQFAQSYSTPDGWSLVGSPESYLRAIETGDEEVDGAYVIPQTTEPHIVDFGETSESGTDITYGVLAEGITEIRLYDADSGDLLQTSVPPHLALNYISELPVRVRVEATIGVSAGGLPIRRKITGVMVTFDGGTKIFTERTTPEDGYTYDYYSEEIPAREQVNSFVTSTLAVDYHTNARETAMRSFDGSRSLEVVYNIVPDDPELIRATPISRPDTRVTAGTYHARAKIMTNMPTVIDVNIEGVQDTVTYSIGANPNHWSDVSFAFEAQELDAPYITITPSASERDLEIYVDTVGIMTEDSPYFDGSTPGPYTWSGAPHSSTSATIPVVGVPAPRMEIMYRHAWIG